MSTGTLLRAAASILLLVTALCVSVAAAADFNKELETATQTLEPLQPQYEQLLAKVTVGEANTVLLNAFPEKTRTAAQAFALGNALFEIDRAASYKLHKRAAELAPNEPAVTLQWAIEQHRAGEFAPALASYQKVSATRSGESVMGGALQADCLLRLGRFDDAAAAWAKSGGAMGGTIDDEVEDLEKLICAVKREPMPYARRAELLKKATQQKDVQAAMDLVVLDCTIPIDWWKVEANQLFLEHDVPAVLAALNLPQTDPRRRAIECAAAIGAIKADDPDGIKQAMTASGFVFDAGHTFPPHSGVALYMMQRSLRVKLMSEPELRDTYIPKLRKQAQTAGKDPAWWEAASQCAAAMQGDQDAHLLLEREAWRATGEARFAGTLLTIRRGNGELSWADAELDAALKQFPEDGPVLHVAVMQAEAPQQVTKQLLAQAAKAEFKHFSSYVARRTAVSRPRVGYLREYFARMSQMAPTPAPAPTPTPGKPKPAPLPF